MDVNTCVTVEALYWRMNGLKDTHSLPKLT